MKSLSNNEERICGSVMSHIARRRVIQARTKAGTYGFFLMAAFIALVPSALYLGEQAVASGFTEYVSLIASDGASLSGSWSALMLSLLDSVPLVGVILTLLTFTVMAYCVQKITRDRVFLAPHLIR